MRPVLRPTGSCAKMHGCQESAENLALEKKNKKIITDFFASAQARAQERMRQNGKQVKQNPENRSSGCLALQGLIKENESRLI